MKSKQVMKILRFNRVFWWVCGALFLVNVIFYTVFIKKQRNQIDVLQQQYTKKRSVRATKKNGNMALYVQAKKDLQFFKSQLLPKTTFADRVRELYDVLQRQNLSVSKMTYKPEKVESLNLWKYTTSFVVSGQYERLKGLIADIQNSSSLFCIEDFSISKKAKDKEHLNLRLKIATYFR
jgi:Tfp pilus assembly protein PilO